MTSRNIHTDTLNLQKEIEKSRDIFQIVKKEEW